MGLLEPLYRLTGRPRRTRVSFDVDDTLVFEGLLQLAAAGPFQGG